MHNPDNALVLYTVLVVLGFMLSPRFGNVRAVLQGAGTTAQGKAK